MAKPRKYNSVEEARAARLAQYRAWRLSHPDYNKTWKRAHPGCNVEAENKRRLLDLKDPTRRERRRLQSAAKYQTFKTKHPARLHALHLQCRLKRLNLLKVVENTLTDEEWFQICESYDNCCAYCGDFANTIDHVVPIVRGGPHSAKNVVPACCSCNSSKGAKPLLVWLAQTA